MLLLTDTRSLFFTISNCAAKTYFQWEVIAWVDLTFALQGLR